MVQAFERQQKGRSFGLRACLAGVIVSFLAVGPSSFGENKPVTPAPPVKSVDTLSSLVAKSRQLESKGEFDKIPALLWPHIEHLDRPGVLMLIKAHTALKDWNEVIRATNLLLSKNPKDTEALTYLGRAQFKRQKKADEAKETLKKAIESNPKFRPAYEVLAEIYEKNPYEQRLLYQDMVDALGPQPDLLTKLCTINTNDGENEQGESYCRKAVVADEKIPDNHVNLGLIAKQKGEPEQAQKILKVAADRFTKSEFAQYENAAFLEGQKNWVDSYKYYDACLRTSADSERCAVGLGNTGVQLKKYERALEAYKIACKKNGRKNAAFVRRSAVVVRQRAEGSWAEKFEELSERCSFL